MLKIVSASLENNLEIMKCLCTYCQLDDATAHSTLRDSKHN